MSHAEFSWQFERNPTGIANVHLAVSAGRLVGVVSHSALRTYVGGRELIVPFLHNVDTHPDFRRRGVFSTLVKASERYVECAGAGLMLGVPNGESMPIFVDRLGWGSLPGPRVSVRVSRPFSLAAQWFGARRTSKPRPSADSGRLGAPLKRGLALREVEGFGSWADDLWQVAKPTAPPTVISGAEYLNWRFLEKPEGRYTCFAVTRLGEPVGYVVTGRTVVRNARVSYVAHSLLHPLYADEYRNVRKRALGLTSPGCVAALDLLYPGDSPGLRSCFLPSPKRLNLIYRLLGDELSRERMETEPLRLQLGDLDFF